MSFIKIRIARGSGFNFNQIKKVTLKFYARQSNINICYYLKPCIPINHRQFF